MVQLGLCAPKVGSLQTCRPRLFDAESILEMLVERVQEAVGKAPEEKQNGNKANGIQRLTERQLGCPGRLVVADAQGALSPEVAAHHGDVRSRHGVLSNWLSQ